MLLALFVYGLQIQFEVPAMLAKRTGLLVPGSIAGVITNLTFNSVAGAETGSLGSRLVQRRHVFGLFVYDAVAVSQSASAGISLATESGRSGWLVCQLCRCPVLCVSASEFTGQLLTSILCCGIWAILLLGKDGLTWWQSRHRQTESQTYPEHPSMRK